MKRIYAIYGGFLLLMLLGGVGAVRVLHSGDVEAALGKLGGGERQYQEARQSLLLSARNPLPSILDFVNSPRSARRAKLQALEVLAELSRQQTVDTCGYRLVPLLSDSSVEVRMAALKALEQFETMSGSRAVARLFAETRDSAMLHHAYEALKGAAEPLQKELNAALNERDSVRIDSCLALLDSLPARKGVMFLRLAEYYGSRGDQQRAASYYRRLGIIKKWWVIGEFENRHMEGFIRDYGPEGKPFSPSDSFAVNDSAYVRWFPLERISPSGEVNLRELFVRQVRTAGYLFTYLHAPEAREARLYIGSDDGPRVWINGELVWGIREYRGTMPDEDCARLPLRKGVNELLIKVTQEMGGWGATVRVADVHGEGMTDVVASLTPELHRTPLDALLERAGKSSVDWDALGDSVAVDDERFAQSVVSAIMEEDRDATQRLAAVGLLTYINEHRMAPVGELAMADYLTRMLQRNERGTLIAAVARCLADMGSAKTLSQGLRLRETGDTHLRYCGNRLISAYAEARIRSFGDILLDSARADAQRLVSEIMSLQPTGSWVLERMAAFHATLGDTATDTLLRRRITMPQVWWVRGVAPGEAEKIISRRRFDALLQGTTFDPHGEPTKGWRKHGRADNRVVAMGFPNDLLSWENASIGLYTEVRSDRARQVYLSVSVPSSYHLVLNGALVASRGATDAARYGSWEAYPSQPQNYDVRRYPVSLRAGDNKLGMLISRLWYNPVAPHYFRIGFSSLDGQPIGIVANRLVDNVEGAVRTAQTTK
ncbi:MAG: hypothetical protein GF331_10285 [Chitinivibrionales bacterium]|nr:hypothetical protein [Chitinivibrionales bacterium]